MSERCPTCGCPVKAVGGSDGTNHYESTYAVEADRLEDERDALKIQVDALKHALREAGL